MSVCIKGSEIAPLPICGSCYWMAPEVICGKPYGFKSDIWAIGCIVLEMANSRIPRSDCTHLRGLFYSKYFTFN